MSPLRASLLLLSVATLAACGDDDTTGPTLASVAGTYHASRVDLTLAGSSEPLNALGLGASVTIELTTQGTTSGTLIVPPELTEDGIEEDVIDLTGTYTISGNTLTFNGQGDSFIPEVPWTIGNGTLTAVRNDPEGTLEVTLTRSQVP
jgi:hypothetical protein